MDFFSVIAARRSVRKFLPDRVPREVMEKMVAAGIEAPSGMNVQGRQYVIVDDSAVLDQIRPVSNALATAPAAVVLVMDRTPSPRGDFHVQDASAAIQNMLLAAVAQGYASCWVEGAVHAHEPHLRKVLGVPEPLRIWAVLPVGKPAENPLRPLKSDQAQVVHINHFGLRAGPSR